MLKARRYLADLGQDIKRSARALMGSPGFTVVALLSLGMGICITACAFSEMNGIVLRNLPVVSVPTCRAIADRTKCRWDCIVQSRVWPRPCPVWQKWIEA